jgi:hypothetical protein
MSLSNFFGARSRKPRPACLWKQTHDWPFETKADAEHHLSVNRTADEMAAFRSPTKPEPVRYRIRHFKRPHGVSFQTPRGMVHGVREFWTVERCKEV